MDLVSYYKSITLELESLKSRVRNFIANQHWLTDGEWKEATLRTMIAKNLPESVKIGRGFVITKNGPTSQCDILLYRSDCPVIFRDQDLVFLTPDSVLGIVEVKSRLSKPACLQAIEKLVEIRRKLRHEGSHACIALFSYETTTDPKDWAKTALTNSCKKPWERIDLINLGCSNFTKWWYKSPFESPANRSAEPAPDYLKWHSYKLENMSAGYFIANLVDAASRGKVGRNDVLWFPEGGKETSCHDVFGINNHS